MKIFIKSLLDLFDYFTQKKIITVIKNQLGLEKPIMLIDVGAHKGEYVSSIKKNFLIEKIFAFEPNIDTYKILKKNVCNDKNIFTFNYGISDKDGKISFNKNMESSSSSINDLNKNSKYFKKKYFFLNFFGSSNVTTKIDIEVMRLENFLSNKKINCIDLLKVDTEGYEYQVLNSLGNQINKIKLIHFEHHYDDMIIKDYKFSEISNLLKKNGFIQVYKIKMNFRKSFEYIYKNKNF
tara:strand:+ start:522 stop:1232 length:711 start_codon:yes stop_codon:yes gene_type:complete